jgi:hypothetical protein
VVEAHERERFREAIPRYFELGGPERRRVPVLVVVELADWAAAEGEHDVALALLGQARADHPRGPGLDRLLLGTGLVLLHGKGRPAAAYSFLLDTLDADPDPEVERAARDALAEIAALQKLPYKPRGRRG